MNNSTNLKVLKYRFNGTHDSFISSYESVIFKNKFKLFLFFLFKFGFNYLKKILALVSKKTNFSHTFLRLSWIAPVYTSWVRMDIVVK